MKPRNVATVQALIRIIVVAVCISSAGVASVLAQTCEDRNPPHAVALLLRLQSYCENYDVPYSFDLYGLAAVAGDEAIPTLRKIALWPTDTPTGIYCQRWVSSARIALAKLGDEKYRDALDDWRQDPKHPYPPVGDLTIVGDDRALRTLIEYLVAHANDPAMINDFGDYSSDAREGLLRDIDSIRSRRRAPGLPNANYSPEGVAQWKGYLASHKDVQLTFPVYPNVADPVFEVPGAESGLGISGRDPGHRGVRGRSGDSDPAAIPAAVGRRRDGIRQRIRHAIRASGIVGERARKYAS